MSLGPGSVLSLVLAGQESASLGVTGFRPTWSASGRSLVPSRVATSSERRQTPSLALLAGLGHFIYVI